MQPFTTRGFQEGFEPELFQALFDFVCTFHKLLPGSRGIGIEVEHHSIGLGKVFDGALPGVKFNDAPLHQRDESLHVLNHQVIAGFVFNLNFDLVQIGCFTQANVTLKEARLGRTFGTANHAQRPIYYMGQNVIGNGEVILRKLHLGNVGSRVNDATRGGLF